MESKEEVKCSDQMDFDIADVPPWALSLFAKMKAEICAETTARIAYTMRLMLDEVKDEIRATSNSFKDSSPQLVGEECSCREIHHAPKCLKKKSVCHAQRKEDKKLAKIEYKASRKERKKATKPHIKSSSTEGDTEEFEASAHSLPPISFKGSYQFIPPSCNESVKLVSISQLATPPPTPRKQSYAGPPMSCTAMLIPPVQFEHAIAVTPAAKAAFEEGLTNETKEDQQQQTSIPHAKEQLKRLASHHSHNSMEEKALDLSLSKQPSLTDVQFEKGASLKSSTPLTPPSPSSNSSAGSEIVIVGVPSDQLPSMSDSEFEVVSLPPNIDPVVENPRQTNNDSPFVSDYYDEDDDIDSNGGDSDAETELLDSEPLNLDDDWNSQEVKRELYPLEKLDKMSLSMSSSSTSTAASTVIEDFLSTCSNEDNNLLEDVAIGAEALPIERQRAPYSVDPEEMRKINSEEVVNSQSLPAEFQRERNPYTGASVQPEPGNPGSIAPPSVDPPTRRPSSTPPPTVKPSDPYRVDTLPETLWEEAMTVAAKGYNAAKMVVGNLGNLVDPFIQTEERMASDPPRTNPPTSQRPTGATAAATAAAAASSTSTASGQRMFTKAEQHLMEMGFTNCSLNAALLDRHKNDLGKVIAELLEQ